MMTIARRTLPVVAATLFVVSATNAGQTRVGCDAFGKIHEAHQELASVSLSVDSRSVAFSEIRNGKKIKLNEPVKQLGLRVLEIATCRTEVVIVKQEGARFTSPVGWNIQPITRSNGIRWNKWSTDWQVLMPTGWIVAEVKYPVVEEEKTPRRIKLRSGKISTVYDRKRTISYRQIFPYSLELHDYLAIARGIDYEGMVIGRALNELRSDGVRSKAFPEMLVADIPQLQRSDLMLISAAEWTDWSEFLLDSKWATDYFWIRLGNNGEAFGRYACNSAGACGVKQFTDARGNGTYSGIRKAYPAAHLIRDFVLGARDHVNVAKAAILLFDTNLKFLIEKEGVAVLTSSRLGEYLFAMYNASPAKVIKAIGRARASKNSDWILQLPRVDRRLRETQEYILKYRYMRDRYPFSDAFLAEVPYTF